MDDVVHSRASFRRRAQRVRAMLQVVTSHDVGEGARWAGLEAQVRDGAFSAALRPASSQEALAEGQRQFVVLAAEVARAQFDPAHQWGEFVQALWEQVDAGFGLTGGDDYDAQLPRAWFEEPDDPDVVVWDRRSDLS